MPYSECQSQLEVGVGAEERCVCAGRVIKDPMSTFIPHGMPPVPAGVALDEYTFSLLRQNFSSVPLSADELQVRAAPPPPRPPSSPSLAPHRAAHPPPHPTPAPRAAPPRAARHLHRR